jgi:hypothetical protein
VRLQTHHVLRMNPHPRPSGLGPQPSALYPTPCTRTQYNITSKHHKRPRLHCCTSSLSIIFTLSTTTTHPCPDHRWTYFSRPRGA